MHDTKRKSSFRTKEVQNEPKSKKQKHSHVYPLWYVVFSQKTKPMQWAETVWVEMFPTFFARTFCTLFFLPGELHRDKRMGLPGPNPGCPGLGVCSGPCKKKFQSQPTGCGSQRWDWAQILAKIYCRNALYLVVRDKWRRHCLPLFLPFPNDQKWRLVFLSGW